jgi:hypothetical protein
MRGYGPLTRSVIFVFFANTASAAEQDDWPPVRPGVWEESGTRTLPNGHSFKASGVRVLSCDAPESVFLPWSGSSNAVLEKEGCSYTSRRTAENTWRVVTECRLRGVKQARGESTIILRGSDEFESDRVFHEDNLLFRLHVVARRLGDCGK